MAFFVALDAGGTRTQCWVADESRVLAQESTGTVKLMAVDEATATGRLRELVQNTLQKAGVSGQEVARTVIGLAGSSSERVQQWATDTLGNVVAGEVILSGDEEIALDAAFQDGPGILIIAGTGSNAVGRCSDGHLERAGGWGPVIGDEGSGHWIGVEAIRTALRAHDRQVDTCLLRAIQEFWSLGTLSELVAVANQRTRPDFAQLTSVIARCAEEGDGLAQSVLERAGEELAAQVSLVASKMHAANCESSETRHVAFAGSVLGKIPAVRRSFMQRLQTALPDAEIASEAVEPLEGALWRARRG